MINITPIMMFQVLLYSVSRSIGCTINMIAPARSDPKAKMKAKQVIILGIKMNTMRYISPIQIPIGIAYKITS